MRIAVDATPAARQRAGVGRYTRELLRALVSASSEHEYLLAVAGSEMDGRRLWSMLPPGAWREVRRLPLSDRASTAAWQRLRLPLTAERFIGSFDLFHGTDFVVPPTRSATVVTIHDLSFLVAPQFSEPRLVRYLSAAVPRAIRRADAIICVSSSVAAEVGTRFPETRTRLFAIPNGVSAPTSVPARHADASPVILTVGTIEPRKDHLCLLDAMEIVWNAYPEARLDIVGRPGWLADEIIRRIHHAQRKRNVRWLSNADDVLLEQCYAAATVFAYPARYEGFGLPVLEAMARGLPIVASDAATLTEVTAGAAIHTPVGDSDALGHALVDLLDCQQARAERAECGLERSRVFSWTKTAAATLHAYEFAIKRWPG
jgi:glycosyltransferase involved in cell wall biosynthesis